MFLIRSISAVLFLILVVSACNRSGGGESVEGISSTDYCWPNDRVGARKMTIKGNRVVYLIRNLVRASQQLNSSS